MQTGYLSLYISGRRIHRRIFWTRKERRELMAYYTRLYKLGNGKATSYFEISEQYFPGIAPEVEGIRRKFVEEDNSTVKNVTAIF